MTYTIAVAQLPVEDQDQRANLRGILEAIDRAAGHKADFLVTPEGALTRYHGRFDRPLRDELMGVIHQACRRRGVTAIIGASDRRRGNVYNEQVIVGGDGEILGRHAKMVPTAGDRKWSVAGRTLRVFSDRGLTFGCLICNDLWVTPGCGNQCDPRLTLRLARKGAKAIFHSVNSAPGSIYTAYHESNLVLRAIEGRVYIATANAAKPTAVNAATGIIGPDGKWIVRCNRRGRQFAVAKVLI